MELEVLKNTLTEIADELQKNNNSMTELSGKVQNMEGMVNGFSNKLDKLKIIAPPASTKPIQDQLAQFHNEISRIVENQPKNVVRQVRILLFPEYNTDYYYRVVFGRLIPWALAFVVAGFLFLLGKQAVEGWSLSHDKVLENDHYRKAWNTMRKQVKPESVKIMQRVWDSSGNDGR